MKIGEIAKQSGLSISNIRFYEKKGLIGPNRDENSQYRIYSNDDLEQLKKIILFRKMDLPVETIGSILNGTVSLEVVIKQQLAELKSKQLMIQGSIDLCDKLVADQAYDYMDLEYYLEYVKSEESNGRKFGNIEILLEDLSEFTQVDKYTQSSVLGWYLFSHPRMNKIFVILWCGLLVLLPVIGIVDDWIDETGPSPVMIIFWIIWLGFWAVSFIGFIKRKSYKLNL